MSDSVKVGMYFCPRCFTWFMPPRESLARPYTAEDVTADDVGVVEQDVCDYAYQWGRADPRAIIAAAWNALEAKERE